MTLNIGYAASSILLISLFLMALVTQLRAKSYNPLLYWTVILATSTAGTTMSDFMDRTLKLGYVNGSLILLCTLIAVLAFWRITVGSLSIDNVRSFRMELLYWTAILVSNTLGTAMGDFLADTSGLGFAGGALLISTLIGLVVLATYYTQISRVALFWIAFVLTRPLGATVGDFLTKTHEKGGLGFGTIGSSLVLAVILIFLIAVTSSKRPVART